MARSARSLLRPVALALVASACLEEPLHPGADQFPELSSAVLSQNCIRGALLPPASVLGVIETRDCHLGPGQGYADAYRIRVLEARTVTVAVEAPEGPGATIFDTELVLFRVDDLDDYAGSQTQLAYDDDSGEGPHAMLTYPLEPFTEYLVVVSGKDDLSRGGYVLRAS